MAEKNSTPAIDRILVAIDASPNSLAALDAAVDLARRNNASLVGLFVEDLNLIRLAELPFSYEVLNKTAILRELGVDDIERQLRIQARKARKALAERAERYGLDWDFRVARGAVPIEVLAEAEEADWIILGKSGWSQARTVGSTTRFLINKADRFIMVLERGLHLQRPVVAVYDGSETAVRSLAAAAMLARSQGVGISVFLLGQDKEELKQLQAEAAETLKSLDVRATYRWFEGAHNHELVNSVQQIGCLLVLPGELPLLRGDPLIDFIDRLQCPVLVVR
ncbi:MAG: universal stress protein [Anaerolineales bacterium]